MSDSSEDTSMTAQSSSSAVEELIGAYGGQYFALSARTISDFFRGVEESHDGGERVEPEDVRPSQFRDKYNGDVAVDQW